MCTTGRNLCPWILQAAKSFHVHVVKQTVNSSLSNNYRRLQSAWFRICREDTLRITHLPFSSSRAVLIRRKLFNFSGSRCTQRNTRNLYPLQVYSSIKFKKLCNFTDKLIDKPVDSENVRLFGLSRPALVRSHRWRRTLLTCRCNCKVLGFLSSPLPL